MLSRAALPNIARLNLGGGDENNTPVNVAANKRPLDVNSAEGVEEATEAKKARLEISPEELLEAIATKMQEENAEAAVEREEKIAIKYHEIVNLPPHLDKYVAVVKNADFIQSSGVELKAGKNLLLSGPLGAGKGTLAKAIAMEADRPMIELEPGAISESLEKVKTASGLGQTVVLFIKDVDQFEGLEALMGSLKKDPHIIVIGSTTGSPALLGTKLRHAFGYEAEMPAHSERSLKEVLWQKLAKIDGVEISREDLMGADLPAGTGTHNMDTLLVEVLLAAKAMAGDDENVTVTAQHLDQGFESFSAIPQRSDHSAIPGLYA